jgi:hypothetical protein
MITWSGEARVERHTRRTVVVIILSHLSRPATPPASALRIARERRMSRQSLLTFLLILGCLTALIVVCFGDALIRGGQFGYRDAGHFYYPLYQRVQMEWDAHRWPLWEPEENSGMPLLGNPTAAVLYPGKVLYAVLPYPWAARVYIIAHTILAFVAMLLAMRGWGVSGTGSAISALTYAFGAPVLFQYCNIIYLVGAAWLPLGFLAIRRWLESRSAWSLLGLAVVLAMQTLGGDPQASYLLGLCGGAYAAGLAWSRRRGVTARGHEASENGRHIAPSNPWWMIPALAAALAAWVAVTLAFAAWLPRIRPAGYPPPALPWMAHVPTVVLVAWGLVGLGFVWRWRRLGWRSPLGVMLLGLAGSAILAGTLSAAQLLPVFEFTQQTVRAAGDGPHDIYPFSIEPFRLAEILWPSVFGTSFGRNAYWIDSMRLPGVRPKIWVPSLYVGSLGLVLAVSVLAFRRGPAPRVWLSWIVLAGLVGSLGQYTSPIWVARLLAETARIDVPDIGALDTNDVTPIRLDRYLRDGDGGIYWWMTTLLPGFKQFRFPAKLFTFTAFGLAALAGMGWDDLPSRRKRGTLALAVVLLAGTAALLVGVVIGREPILTRFGASTAGSAFGPLDVRAGYAELVRSLVHGLAMFALTIGLLLLSRRRPATAGLLAVALVALDLAVANSRYVSTVPQSLMETRPEVARLIEEAERKNPSPGPYRVHRMPQWNPLNWHSEDSDDRISDFVTWERRTIQPKYGITLGVEYTHTMGVAELYDYEWFFGGFPYAVRGETARSLGVEPGKKVVYFPRRAFDMWNTRYFILPEYPNGWADEFRGYAAFLHETEPIYPLPQAAPTPEQRDAIRKRIETEDFQIRRNRQQYPRAWVVHAARGLPKLEGLRRAERSGPMQEILYADDPIWHDPKQTALDPHLLAWIDRDDLIRVRPYLSGGPPRATESVTVFYPSPRQAVLDVTLDQPGIVVLADVYYPGWKLTIDDQPAPIIPVNRMMRGAAVESGPHHLVYTYDPWSFRLGVIITLAGSALWLLLAIFCAFRTIRS